MAAPSVHVATSSLPLVRRVMPRGMFVREVLVNLSRPRALAIKVAMPLVLTIPLVAGHAPTFWAAMLLTVLAAMIGTVGAAVTVSRARDSGLLTRVALTPRPAWRTVAEWVLGSALIDMLQLTPSLIAIFLLAPVTVVSAVVILASIASVLLLANVLGSVISSIGGGPGEVLLDVMVVLAPLLFLGGLFTGIPHEGWRWIAAHVDPFAYLHAAFIDALGGTATFDRIAIVAAALVTAAGAVVALATCGGAVLRRR
jgi:hypothetical protein